MSLEKLWGIVKVALPTALVLVLIAGQAHAQRQGRLQNGQGQCAGRQFGMSNSLGTQGFGSQLSSYGYPQGQQYSLLQQQELYNLQQQLLLQAQLNAMQANALQANAFQANAFQANALPANAVRRLNAIQQYVADQQMLGVAPEDALQSALYALQRTPARQSSRNQR
jgi:hypothetical protein